MTHVNCMGLDFLITPPPSPFQILFRQNSMNPKAQQHLFLSSKSSKVEFQGRRDQCRQTLVKYSSCSTTPLSYFIMVM